MTAPTPIPFGNWEPDKSDRANPTTEAKGCISQAGQYAPFPDFVDYGADATTTAATAILLHFDGADAATTITDNAPTPHTWTAAGNAQLDTAESALGESSLL